MEGGFGLGLQPLARGVLRGLVSAVPDGLELPGQGKAGAQPARHAGGSRRGSTAFLDQVQLELRLAQEAPEWDEGGLRLGAFPGFHAGRRAEGDQRGSLPGGE